MGVGLNIIVLIIFINPFGLNQYRSWTDNYWDTCYNCDITETDSNSYTEPLGGGFDYLNVTFRVNCLDYLDYINISQYSIKNI